MTYARWLRGAAVAFGMVLVAACSDGVAEELIGPTEAPIPPFQYSFLGCLSWSCQSGQCSNDPTVWGACCLEVSEDPEDEGLTPPSCGGMTYCEQFPSRCEGDDLGEPGLAAEWCFHANPADICNDPLFGGGANCGSGGLTIWDFPECFPTGAP